MTGTGTETETGPETAPAGPSGVTFGVDLSRGFTEWLATKRISLAMTTCQVGRLILSGLDEEGQLWSYNRNIPRCLGLCVDGDGFRVTGDVQLIRFDNLLPPGQTGQDGTDALYAPRFSCFTGDPDIHDVARPAEGPRRSSPTRCSTAWRDPACHMVSGRSGNRTSFPAGCGRPVSSERYRHM